MQSFSKWRHLSVIQGALIEHLKLFLCLEKTIWFLNELLVMEPFCWKITKGFAGSFFTVFGFPGDYNEYSK